MTAGQIVAMVVIMGFLVWILAPWLPTPKRTPAEEKVQRRVEQFGLLLVVPSLLGLVLFIAAWLTAPDRSPCEHQEGAANACAGWEDSK